ncbi:cleavage stimulation factor subunit 2-like [Acanthaster planci]|uniref:Cleavage stimulation factor subunit 2-like n=1 Tax=Acanthaster planci TaxID=133434 RepID=A0A8B7XNU7_ACAPL|nr:cleavage stimulation factor subunit 2-like [Acanthaster planci]
MYMPQRVDYIRALCSTRRVLKFFAFGCANGTEMSAIERSLRSVFVGNIPYDATEEKLKDIFSEVGPVISFRLVYDRESGKPKGYGFCEYKDQETALSAMRNLNGYELNGRALRVDNAASEKNKEELKNLVPAAPASESPFGEAVPPHEAPEAISKAVASLPPEQMFELMKQMKMVIQNNPVEARNMLLQNPQLAYALLQAQVVMRIVNPEIAVTLLHKQVNAPQALLPPELPQPAMGVPTQQQQQQQIPHPIQQQPQQQTMLAGQGPGGMMRPLLGPNAMDNRGPIDSRGPIMQQGPSGPIGMDRMDTEHMGQRGMPLGQDRGPFEHRGPMDPRGPAPDIRGQTDPRSHDPRRPDLRGQDIRGFDSRGGDPRTQPMMAGDPRVLERGMPGGPQGGPSGPGGPGGFGNTQPTQQDQDKAALIMQVLQLSPEQINLLPPEQKASIMFLKDQIARSQGQIP